MRRLVIEADTESVAAFVGERIKEIERGEVMAFLKTGPEETAFVMRLRFKDPASKPSGFMFGGKGKVHILERGKDGTWTIYWRGKADRHQLDLWNVGGYLATPYEFRDGKLKITFLGSSKEVKAFLGLIQRLRIKYKLNLLTDAKFPPDSPLGLLTERQRQVLAMAFKMGYYDIPRRADSDELAARLGTSNPAFVMHRRKAERTLIAAELHGTSAHV